MLKDSEAHNGFGLQMHIDWWRKYFFPPSILYYIINFETVERSVKSTITLEGRYLCHSLNNALYILNSISGTFPWCSKVSYCDLLWPCIIKEKGSHVKLIHLNWLWIHLVAFRAAVKDHGCGRHLALLRLPAVPQKGAYALDFCSCHQEHLHITWYWWLVGLTFAAPQYLTYFCILLVFI